MLINIFFSFIDWIVVGSTDLHVTTLTDNITANVTTIDVSNTGGYKVADYVWVEDEKIAYNGKTTTSFLYATRGYDNTEAVEHSYGSHVYGASSEALNTSVGFNIVNTGASVGSINTMTMVVRFVTTTVPQMVQWNFYWMKEGFWQYLRLLFAAISGALVFLVALQLLSALGGLLQSAFNR